MKKSLFLFIFIAFLAKFLAAVPADQAPHTVTLKDGRSLTYIVYGDEFNHAYKTLDSYTILTNSDNEWVYAVTDPSGDLAPSNVAACNAAERTSSENAFLAGVPKNITYSEKQLEIPLQERKSLTKLSSSFPTKGKVNLLILLIDFPGKEFFRGAEDTRNYFQNMAMGSDGEYSGNGNSATGMKTGSIRTYYLENSSSQLDLQIDVKGPFRAKKPYTYYGEDRGGYTDIYLDELMREIITQAEKEGVDFTKYDNTENGFVDAVHFIYAGGSQASTGRPEDIWPKRSFFQPIRPRPNGKWIENWSCSSEFQGNSTFFRGGVGVTCHELSHVLGLPDWYDTEHEGSGKNYVMGEYSIMDAGPYNNNENTPPNLTAIEKEMLNWHEHAVLDSAGVYTLPIWSNDGNSLSYKLTTPDAKEYYVLENRQKKGWDSALPGTGMLIYYVDQSMVDKWYQTPPRNDINAITDSMGCFIICADNDRRDTRTSMSRDPYPYNTNNSFTNTSIPKIQLRYSSEPFQKPITQITRNADSTIQFIYNYNTISIATEVLCDSTVENIAPLTAGSYENSTYAWQIIENGEWINAPGEYTESQYKITEFKEGMEYRRIVTSQDKSDTSRVFKPVYDPSVGGNITPAENTIKKDAAGFFTLKNYKNNVLHWERKEAGDEDWGIINNNTATLNEKYATAGTFILRAVVQNAKCPAAYSSEAQIIVIDNGNPINLNNFVISPNPSSGVIYISSSTNDLFDIDIFNTAGKIVYSKKGVNLSTESIDLKGIDSGVYIIQMLNQKDNSIQSKKFIITRSK